MVAGMILLPLRLREHFLFTINYLPWTAPAAVYSSASPSIWASLCCDGHCVSAKEQNTQHLPVRGRSIAPQLVHG